MVQESLGFSPAELVFGHTLRGPSKVLREQLVLEYTPNPNILANAFRERFYNACEVAKAALGRLR